MNDLQLTAVDLRTVNGSIRLEDVDADEVRATTVNGGVRVRGAVKELHGETTNGSIDARLEERGHNGFVSQADWHLDTTNGSVRVAVPTGDDIGYSVNLRTVSGRVKVGLPGFIISDGVGDAEESVVAVGRHGRQAAPHRLVGGNGARLGRRQRRRRGVTSAAAKERGIGVNDERLQILRMVEEGKVSADEAAKLLEALGGDASSSVEPSRRRNRFVRVKVVDGDKTKVNVNLPLELARVALKFIPQATLSSAGAAELNLEHIVELLEQGVEGKLIDIEDGDTKVEVYVE